MYRHWKTEGWSNLMLLFLALIVIINSGVIIGLQLITSYPHHSRDEILSQYEEYNCIDLQITDKVSAWLLAAPAKETRLIIAEKHFLANRHRMVLDTEIERHFSASLKTDSGAVTVRIQGISKIDSLSLRPSSLPVRFSTIQTRIPISFLLWNLLMLGIEILIAVLFHKIRTH